ncbi:hypothetical protein EBZ37_09075 [bacterium]|nr:hypothetical protein [bacterium]
MCAFVDQNKDGMVSRSPHDKRRDAHYKPARIFEQPCHAGLKRNMEYGQKMKITGTPTTLLPDGTRIPGAIELAQIEKMLAKQ